MNPPHFSDPQTREQTPAAPLGVSSGSSRWGSVRRREDDARLLEGLRRAVESGATFLDTADHHGLGRAERLVGRVLSEHPARQIDVLSKVGHIQGSASHPYAGPRLRQQLEQSLENLCIDSLAVYALASWDFGAEDRYLTSVVQQLHVMKELGYIGAIGLCVPGSRAQRMQRSRRFLELFSRVGPDVVWTQASGLNPLLQLGEGGEDLGSFTARQGVRLVIASPLAHGALVGADPAVACRVWGDGSCTTVESVSALLSSEVKRLVAMDLEPARLALGWLLRQAPHAVLAVGVADGFVVDRNVVWPVAPLSENEYQAADAAFARVRSVFNRADGRAVEHSA